MQEIEPHEIQNIADGYKGMREFWMEDIGRQLAERATCCLRAEDSPLQRAGNSGNPSGRGETGNPGGRGNPVNPDGSGDFANRGDGAIPGDSGNLGSPSDMVRASAVKSELGKMIDRADRINRKLNQYWDELELCKKYSPEHANFVDVLQKHGESIDKDKNQQFSVEELKEFYNRYKKELAIGNTPEVKRDLHSIDWAIKNWNKFGLKTGRQGGGQTTLETARQGMFLDMHNKVPKEMKQGLLSTRELGQLERYFAALKELGKP